MGLADFLLGTGRAAESRIGTPPQTRALSLDGLALDELRGTGAVSVGGVATRKDWWTDGDERSLSTSAIVRRCLSIITQPLAGIDLTVLAGEEEVTHPFVDVFNKGGIGQPLSARIVKETTLARLEWRGQCFLFLDRGDSGTGPVRAISPLYRQTQGVVDRDGGMERLVGYRTRDEHGQWQGLLPSEVLWLRYPDPDDPWGCVAPWTSARWAAKLDRKGQGWMDEELTNGNRAAAVVYLGDLAPEDHDKAHALWGRTMQGPKSSGRAFLVSGPAPAKVERLGLTAREAAYLDTRKANAEEVALAFGIDRDYIFGESTFENKRTAKTILWSDTLIPKLEVLASEIDRQMLPEPSLEAAWDLSGVEALHENESSVVERLVAQLNADALTIDEARAEQGREPLPGGLGAQTLTAYRKALTGGSLPPAAPVDPMADEPVRTRRYITRRGEVRVKPRRPRIVTRSAGSDPRDRERLDRVFDRLEARGVRLVHAFAERQGRAIIRNYRKAQERAARGAAERRAGVDEFYDGAYWQRELTESLDGWLSDVWDEGGTRTAASLGIGFDTFDHAVTVAMRSRLDTLAEQVSSTTRGVLESDVLARAAEEGLSVDDTVALMRERFEDLGTRRAEMIARTETVGGFNGASRRVAVGSGVVTRRQWLATIDTRTRDSHARLNGHTTLGMDDPYPNGLMYPGDPSGPPSETVHCRCTEIFETEEETT